MKYNALRFLFEIENACAKKYSNGICKLYTLTAHLQMLEKYAKNAQANQGCI